MRIGVVCEGPTDYPSIEHFVGSALKSLGIDATFRALFPDMDRTRPEGGWAQVLTWLRKYPPETRIQQYFSGGLFGGSLAFEPLDAILFQLDTDVLDDDSFCNFVKKHYSITVASPLSPPDRAAEITKTLSAALRCEELTHADAAKHVIFPAVESTEAWCVAIFTAKPSNSELLKNEQLTNAFMRALESSESKDPEDQYFNVDKTLHRREKFCQIHSHNSDRIMINCEQFSIGVRKLAELNP